MALINSQNRNSQRRGQMVNAYGAPIFDEAQLRALFQQIGTLDSTASGEGGDQKKLAARTALGRKFGDQAAEIKTYRNVAVNSFEDGIVNLVAPRQFYYGGNYNGNVVSTINANNSIVKADTAFVNLLKKVGFSSETVNAAADAIAVIEKYTLWTNPKDVSWSPSAYPFPNTTAVAKTIMTTLYTLGQAITAVDLYEGVYPLEPNALAPDYTAKFDVYFAANYVP